MRRKKKLTWRRQVEESVKKVGLKIEEAGDRTRWREGVRAIAVGMRCIRPPSGSRKPDCNRIASFSENEVGSVLVMASPQWLLRTVFLPTLLHIVYVDGLIFCISLSIISSL